MDPSHRHHHDPVPPSVSLNRLTTSATVHCLTGCAIGEVLGLVIGTAYGLRTSVSIALSIVLAFGFGYAMTLIPLLRAGMEARPAIVLALGSDTVSIMVMETVDTLIMLGVPGAMQAGLRDPLFWTTLLVSLAAAFIAAWPVNRWLIALGLGHAVVHRHHH